MKKTKEMKFEFPLERSTSFQFEADSSPILRYFIQAFKEGDGVSSELVEMMEKMIGDCKARMFFNVFITEKEIDFKEVKQHDDLFDL